MSLYYDYWKSYIEDYLSCVPYECEITEEDYKAIANDILDSDFIWNEIDSIIANRLNKKI